MDTMMGEALMLETEEGTKEVLPEGGTLDPKGVMAALGARPGDAENPSIYTTTGKVVEGRKEAAKKGAGSLERIPSGIPGLDDEIEGGFIRNSVNLVAGSPGAGKSIFAMQFLLEGLRQGESCLFVSFEENKSSVYKYMATFGWDLEAYEDRRKFFFMRYSPSQVYKLLEEGGGMVENIIRTYGVTRIAIDSMTSFTLLYRDELAVREALLSLFNLIGEWRCTTVLTAEQESNPEQHKPSIIEFEVDSVILLYNFRTSQNVRQRVAEILKMRGTRFAQKIFPMKIESRGLSFYPHDLAY